MTTGRVIPLLRPAPPWTPGDRLRRVRREVKMSQDDFAAVLKLNNKTLAAYESGIRQIPPAELNRLARLIQRHFGFPALWLVTGNDEDGGPTPNQRLFDGPNQRPTAYKSHGSRRGTLAAVA